MNNMSWLFPFHQFEIRFTKQINFRSHADEILSPFIKTVSDVHIENNARYGSQITLDLYSNGTTLAVYWDRLVYQCNDANFEALKDSNGDIASFPIKVLKRFMNHSTFGKVRNSLWYTVAVKLGEKENIDNQYLKEYCKKVMDYNDFAVVLENKNPKGEDHVTFGKYVGLEDLSRRGINVNYLEKAQYSGSGVMAEYKRWITEEDVSLKSYKNSVKELDNVLSKL